jgi:hypothetical protein
MVFQPYPELRLRFIVFRTAAAAAAAAAVYFETAALFWYLGEHGIFLQSSCFVISKPKDHHFF